MRKVDFIVQSILLLACAIMLIVVWYHAEMLFLFLLGQFLIGIWQYGATFLSFFHGSVIYRKKYFLVATMYLIILILIGFNPHIPSNVFLVYFFIPPWFLALYYYSMTWRSFFIHYKKRSSGFLPHTNF